MSRWKPKRRDAVGEFAEHIAAIAGIGTDGACAPSTSPGATKDNLRKAVSDFCTYWRCECGNFNVAPWCPCCARDRPDTA